MTHEVTGVRAIGAALVAARERGEPWKVLQQKFGYSRTWLWKLWRAARNEARKAA